LASQKSLAAESKRLHSQLSTLQSENTRLTVENKTFSNSLTTAQNEIKTLQNETKTLQAKLTTLRNAKTDAPAKTVPGSAVKARGGLPGKKDEEEKIKIMQLKEDLYSDITGLMIHSVNRDDNEDIYDCIQTGRNGSTSLPPPLFQPRII
jgi:predicted  nucleic acid-binding Zn-ribbon protein